MLYHGENCELKKNDAIYMCDNNKKIKILIKIVTEKNENWTLEIHFYRTLVTEFGGQSA